LLSNRQKMAESSYAVMWSNGDTEPTRVGKLEVRDEYFALHGGTGQREVREHVAYPEVKAVHRKRLGSAPALKINRSCGPPLLLASIGGVGLLHEIADALTTGLT
jgi:hypothetical protein